MPEFGDLTAEDAIRVWAAGAFGFDVIWIEDTFPKLPRPYATLKWFSERTIGIANRELIPLALDTSEKIQETKLLTIQLDVYTVPATGIGGPDALETIEGALVTLQTDAVIRGFRESDISFVNHEIILRLDEFDGDRWEQRATCDLHFFITNENTPELIGRIDAAVPQITINE